jgi:hypothetical protein
MAHCRFLSRADDAEEIFGGNLFFKLKIKPSKNFVLPDQLKIKGTVIPL